jgi:hypothetical protein
MAYVTSMIHGIHQPFLAFPSYADTGPRSSRLVAGFNSLPHLVGFALIGQERPVYISDFDDFLENTANFDEILQTSTAGTFTALSAECVAVCWA